MENVLNNEYLNNDILGIAELMQDIKRESNFNIAKERAKFQNCRINKDMVKLVIENVLSATMLEGLGSNPGARRILKTLYDSVDWENTEDDYTLAVSREKEGTRLPNSALAVMDALNGLMTIDFEVSKFGNFAKIIARTKDRDDNEVIISIDDEDVLYNIILSVANSIKSSAIKILNVLIGGLRKEIKKQACETLFLYNIEMENNKKVESFRELIQKFINVWDSQLGDGGIASILLYPYIKLSRDERFYNVNNELGLPRTQLLGTVPSSGKSMIGKLMVLFYNEFGTLAGLPPASKGEYLLNIQQYNNSIKDYPAVYIDDDKSTAGSLHDELKTWYTEKMFITGSVKDVRHETFKGIVTRCMNNFYEFLTAEEIEKRVLIYHFDKSLLDFVEDGTIEKRDIGDFYDMVTFYQKEARQALVEILEDSIDKAVRYLMNYKSPALDAYKHCNDPLNDFLIDCFNTEPASVSGYVLLSSVANRFKGITSKNIESETGGLFTVKRKRTKEGQCFAVVIKDMELFNRVVNTTEDITDEFIDVDIEIEDAPMALQLHENLWSAPSKPLYRNADTATELFSLFSEAVDKASNDFKNVHNTSNRTHYENVEDIPLDGRKQTKEYISNNKATTQFSINEYKEKRDNKNEKSNGLLSQNNILHTSGVLLDIDDSSLGFNELLNVLRTLNTLLFVKTSITDSEDKTKLHVVIPTNKPITDRYTYEATIQHISDELLKHGVVVDEQAKDFGRRLGLASSMRHKPVMLEGKMLEPLYIEGKRLMIDTLDKRQQVISAMSHIKIDGSSLEAIANTIKNAPSGSRNSVLNKALFIAKLKGATVEQLTKLAYNSSLPQSEIEATIESVKNAEIGR